MALILNDILIDIEHSDLEFTNPLPLLDELGSEMGYAELLPRSDRLYATLYIADDNYTDAYPKVVVDSKEGKISCVILSPSANEDVRIEKIADQEVFQSSSGAENADMK